MKLDELVERLMSELSPSTTSGNQSARNRGKSGQYPVPDTMSATGSGQIEKQDDMLKIEDAQSDTVVYRGLRDITLQDIAKITKSQAQRAGTADLNFVDKKGYWSSNPRIATIYATSPATTERGNPVMAILRGKTQSAATGKAQAFNPGTVVTVDKIWWADDMTKLKSVNLTEAKEPEKKDLGFGFNEDGFPLQNKYEFQGMPIAVENKKGSKRSWYDEHGNEKGSTKMRFDYGYVEGALGADGDEVDVYIGPNEDAEFAFVVHQNKKPEFTEYDEDKVMLGFKDEQAARKAYLKQYDDPGFYGGMSSMPIEKFKEKVTAGSGKKITNEIFRLVIESLREDDKASASFNMDDFEDKTQTDTGSDIKIGSPDEPVKKQLPKADETVGRKMIADFRELMMTKRHLNIPQNPALLGVGTKGTAFDIGAGKTLKVTSDDEEAVAANKIKQLGELKHVYRVFDVFQFRDTGYYGIVQELLKPMAGLPKTGLQFGDAVTGPAADFNEALTKLDFWQCVDRAASWQDVRKNVIDRTQARAAKMAPGAAQTYLKQANEAWQFIREMGVDEMFKELQSAGIEFRDYHAGNIMQRPNGDWVIIDLGYSRVEGGRQPDVLEKKRVTEGKSDSLGITIGRFQPFHKGHAEIIRLLAQKHTKTIVFVAGLKKDDKNPFSYELRVELLRASLPDFDEKIEVYKAEANGKQNAYMPELIDGIVRDKNSTLEPGVSGNVAVSPDRAPDIKRQLDHAAKAKEQEPELLPGFDPSIFVVEEVPALSNDGDTERVSGTRIREALQNDDKEAVRAMLDPHLSSDETKFDGFYDRMREELGLKNESVIREDFTSAGGLSGLMAVARQSGNILKVRLGVDLETAKVLGNGQKGAALDIGSGKVLKLTTDAKEASAAHALEGKATSKIARIFKVFRFKDKAGNEDVFGIEQEKVEPITPDEGREFDAAMKQINDAEEADDHDGPMTALAHGDIDRMYKFMQVFWAKDVREDMQYPIGSPPVPRKEQKLAQVIQQREQILRKTLEKFQVPAMMEELKSNNIQFADYHAGNIGKRADEYVVFDLGMSKVDGGSEPPVLERIVRAVIERLGTPASPTDYASSTARVGSSPGSRGDTLIGRRVGDCEDLEGSHDKLTTPALPPKFEADETRHVRFEDLDALGPIVGHVLRSLSAAKK